MANCYRCEVILTDYNKSVEHIIINACGGRLKSSNLLCKNCNSTFGKSFDAELARTTNQLANLLMIKRERGKPQPIRGIATKSKNEYYLDANGFPQITKPNISIYTDKNNQKRLIGEVKNKKELQKILEGLKRKYPDIEIQTILDNAQIQKEYLNENIQFNLSIGGNEVFKSITKTAINFFIHKNGDKSEIKHLLPYLNNNSNLDVCWMYYPETRPYELKKAEVTHIIKIIGNKKSGLLYAYIELFNVHNFIVLLNTDYKGIDYNSSYIYDVIERIEIHEKFDLGLSKTDFIEIFKKKSPWQEEIKKRLTRVISISDQIQLKYHKDHLVNLVMKRFAERIREGEKIKKTQINEFIQDIIKEVLPFLTSKS